MSQVIRLRLGDCIEVLKGIETGTVGAVITDPPYLINFMGKSWDDTEGCQIEWHRQWLQEAYRVLRSGGIAKVFSATRTFHRLAAAMEDVGFILDPDYSILGWVYGSGFPKSLSISKALSGGATKEATRFDGFGTALKPAFEPFIVGVKQPGIR